MTLRYEYDDVGRLTAVTYPDGEVVRYRTASADLAPPAPAPAAEPLGAPVFCMECGAGAETGDRFCLKCGAPFE